MKKILRKENKFSHLFFVLGVIYLIIFLIVMFIRIGFDLLFLRIFNKQKYYLQMYYLDKNF